MTTLAETRDGLEARLNTILGLRVFDYVPADIAGYPAAVIVPPTHADYRDDLGFGSYTVDFVVLLFVPAAVDRIQLDLYALMDRTGSSSVFAAVEADRSLGGLDVDAMVVSAQDPLQLADVASTQVYQRAVSVRVTITS